MKTLVIIGNGFDLYHELKTTYLDFARCVDGSVADKYIHIFPLNLEKSTLWNNFEEALGEIDMEEVVAYLTDCSSYNSYDADDWSDADHHWHSQIFQDVFDLEKYFKTYLIEDVIPEIHNMNPKMEINVPVSVINFNYTPTIERYGVSRRNIHYIHGKYDDQIVLGHNSDVEINRIKRYNEQLQNQYESEGVVIDSVGSRELETYNEVLSFLKLHKKNHKANFAALQLDWSEYDKVVCLGHSCAPVDVPYFKLIHSSVKKYRGEIPWIFSYYDQNNIVPSDLENIVRVLEIRNYEFIPSVNDIIENHLSADD